MNIPITTAIQQWHSFLAAVIPRLVQSPKYEPMRSFWPDYLRFVQPIITGEAVFDAEAMEAAVRFQREQTSVMDEQATERALYFGVMAFTLLVQNKERHNYGMIDATELAEK